MASTIKQELLSKIASTNDESLLRTLNEDFEYLKGIGNMGVFPELSAKDNAELMEMLDEPFGSNTESYEEFKSAIDKWRTK